MKTYCAILRVVPGKERKTTFMKQFFRTHKHIWTVSYALIYLPWFIWLESRANQPYHVIHMAIDDKIPFVEHFIIPYLLWFLYVAAVYVYLFFQSKKEFYQYCAFIFTGMTLFLIISTVYPNGHLLRPEEFERHNIFTAMVQFLYQADTSTNILPSIHTFNSIGAHLAVVHNRKLYENRWIRNGSRLLMVSILLSTVFLKQHSMLDLITGVLLGLIMDQLVYHWDYVPLLTKLHSRAQQAKGKRSKPKKGVAF